MSDQQEKWNAIYSNSDWDGIEVSRVLQENLHLLPEHGIALDYASGLGANALALAKLSFVTHAWDISAEALSKLSLKADELALTVHTEVRDVEVNPPESQQFDVIVVANFLHRVSFHKLIDALNNNGLLFYQTFIEEKVIDIGPNNPNYLLRKNELLNNCQSMDVLVYREEGKQGNVKTGWRNQAMIVARKS